MTSGWRKNPVLVALYVEAPRKRRLMTNNNQQNHQHRQSYLHHHHHHLHHHHHHHLFVHQKPKQGGGNIRKPELLDYSRRLRESAKPQKTPLLQLQPKPAGTFQQSRSQIIPVQNKPRPARVQTCFGTLIIRLPGFSRKKKNKNGQSAKETMKSIVKSFRVQRKGGFFSRMFGSLRRKR